MVSCFFSMVFYWWFISLSNPRFMYVYIYVIFTNRYDLLDIRRDEAADSFKSDKNVRVLTREVSKVYIIYTDGKNCHFLFSVWLINIEKLLWSQGGKNLKRSFWLMHNNNCYWSSHYSRFDWEDLPLAKFLFYQPKQISLFLWTMSHATCLVEG